MMMTAAAGGTSAFGAAEIFEFLEKYIFRFPVILTLLFPSKTINEEMEDKIFS